MNSYVSSIYNTENDIWGYPQEYKGIQIYPLKIKDVKYTRNFYMLFARPKSYIADKTIIKMSYLKFMLYVVQGSFDKDGQKIDLQKELIQFLEHILRIDNEPVEVSLFYKELPENENIYDQFSLFIKVSGNKEVVLTEQDFENIREIILEQSNTSVEYVESYNPELETKLEFLNNASSPMNFKEEIFSFCALTKMSEIEAGEKTLFQFFSRLEREMLLKDYEIFKAMEASGFISSKTESKEIFKHYLSHIKSNGRYDALMLNPDEYLRDSGLSNPDSNVIIEK